MGLQWVFIIMFALLFLRVPIAAAMGIAAGLALWLDGIPMTVIPSRMFATLNSFTLMAIPFFVFVGNAMNTGGVSARIFNFARACLRHRTGSLGHVNILASIIFAGKSGSAVADAYGLGLIQIQEMRKSGYDDDFSTGITAASSTIGPIIPPSIMMVLYAVLAEQSVGRMFMGGYVPGLLMGLALMLAVYFTAKRKGYKIEERSTWAERLKVTISAIPSLLSPVLLFVLIIMGVITPTEGAVVVGGYAIILGVFIHREMGAKALYNIILQSVKGSASVMLIISSASILTWVILTSGLPALLTNTLLGITDNRFIILLLINLVLLMMGTLMEGTSIMMIMVPLLLPIAHALDINLVHLGIIMVFNITLGNITPPFGLCLFVVAKVANMPFERMAKAILPFLWPLLVVLLLITFIPQIVLFLPTLLMG